MFSPRTSQKIIGLTFTTMGLAVLFFPITTLRLSLTDQSFSSICNFGQVIPATKLIFQCFGAQATLCGTLILCTNFTKQSYLIFASAIAPFFWFDYWAWERGFVNALGAVGDALGNLIFVGFSIIAYSRIDKKNS
jgi:hypothetical protein